ncbi:ATP synthase F1 subunit delta [Psychroserpens damuponensis]|uniref:ATP synthase F1 subunit delta n=1 Tax=Psychroserpens damuponensis TaxID=943936 RepID=UPI00058DF14F|nr:ATP synthase F1 subunit delta [Psychroserpens damuponensis]
MAGTRAAIRYAKAVLSLAQEQKLEDTINSDMKLIASTIADSKELKLTLQNPVVRSSVKKSILLEVFKNLNPLSAKLVDTLIENKRISSIGDVATQYNELYDQLKETQVATVTTAVELSDDLRTKVLAKLKELTGKEVEINSVIDPSILGGFILRIGDIQYNASVANKLNTLKREFTLN